MSDAPIEQEEAVKIEFAEIQDESEMLGDADAHRNLEVIYDIPVRVSAELGRTSIALRELLMLKPGSVVELERLAGESIDLVVNGIRIGRADVVVVHENFGLRITEIIGVSERLSQISA